MDVQERVRAVIEPLLAPRGIEVVDVQVVGSGRSRVLRLSVDRDGGVDLATITEASELVSPALDADDPVAGPYTLEVSSPGVERPLHTPAHFRRVVGEKVTAKTHEEIGGERRHEGTLVEVGDDGIVLDVDGERRPLRFDQIARARTVFEWGPAPRPGKSQQAQTEKTRTEKTGTKTKATAKATAKATQ